MIIWGIPIRVVENELTKRFGYYFTTTSDNEERIHMEERPISTEPTDPLADPGQESAPEPEHTPASPAEQGVPQTEPEPEAPSEEPEPEPSEEPAQPSEGEPSPEEASSESGD